MKTAFAALALLVIASCGREPLPSHMPSTSGRRARAVAVQTWQIGDDLAARKRVVVDTCRQAGKDEGTASLLLAIAMGESERCSAKDRDLSKDSCGDTGARNYSAYNLNGDFLNSIGITGGAAEALNDDSNLPAATRAVLAGIDKYGTMKFLAYHRGGAAARDDGVSYGAKEYSEAILSVQAYIMQDKARMTSGERFGTFIPHV